MKARKLSPAELTQFNEIQIHYKRPPIDSLIKVVSAEDANAVLRSFIDLKRIDLKEFFWVILLSNSNHVLGLSEISIGNSKGTVTNFREIIQMALLSNSSALIIAHNHPSGSLVPSKADLKVTEDLKQIVKVLDIELLDHLIITSEGFYSIVSKTDG